jgi:hypothetical protein
LSTGEIIGSPWLLIANDLAVQMPVLAVQLGKDLRRKEKSVSQIEAQISVD